MKRIVLSFILMLALAGVAIAQEETPEPTTSDDAAQPYLGIRYDASAEEITIDVQSGSPAEEAGLMTGDIITAINGEVVTVETLADVVNSFSVGDTITITITRNDESQDIDVTLGERPAMITGLRFRNDDNNTIPRVMMHGTFLGVQVNEDMVVEEVISGSPAESAGIEVGDVLVAINGEDISTPQSVIEAVMQSLTEGTVTITVDRDGETLDLEAELMGEFSFDRIMPFDGENSPFGRGFRTTPSQRIVLGVAYEMVDDGALITSVLADSPAEAAGLQVDDIVQAVDGDVVDAERTLSDRLYAYEEGDTITLSILRNGESLEIEVTLAQVSSQAATELPSTGM